MTYSDFAVAVFVTGIAKMIIARIARKVLELKTATPEDGSIDITSDEEGEEKEEDEGGEETFEI